MFEGSNRQWVTVGPAGLYELNMRKRSTNAGDAPARLSIPTALTDAIELCKRRCVQLTAARRALLEILWEQPCRPQGAYPLMRRLETVYGRPVTATSVYRALEFLLDQGLAMRIESRNAYLPCPHPETPWVSAFFLRDVCGNATGLNDAAVECLLDERAR